MAKIRYSNGKYWANGRIVEPQRIREYDRRKLRDNAGKALDIDLLGGRAIKKTYSRRNPRR